MTKARAQAMRDAIMEDPYANWHPEEANNEPNDLPDKVIVPIVERLRHIGVVTFQSCSGHYAGEGYISIRPDTVDETSVHALFGEPFSEISRGWWPLERWDFRWAIPETKQALAALIQLRPKRKSA